MSSRCFVPVFVASGNRLAGARLSVDPDSNAVRQVAEWQATKPEDLQQVAKIAPTSQAD